MDEFKRHNLFLSSKDDFQKNDPHLSLLKELKYIYHPHWWRDIDWSFPAIYLLTGGRQIGKSTSMKLLIDDVLERKIFSPHQIYYLPCDQVDDGHHLSRLISFFLEGLKTDRFLLVIDEITFVKEWDRAIKALADDGSLRNGICLLTGSDSIVLKDAAARFPGRRGNAEKVDFQIHPLNFREYIALVAPDLLDKPEDRIQGLFEKFEGFQKCGGYLKAINDLHSQGEIRAATYMTFEQWIRGDFEKKKKDSRILMGVLKTILETTGSQVTFSSLAHRMGEVVKETFNDYLGLLERMDILFILEAFDQNTGLGFPKKARKIHFWDPFIVDTVSRWLVAERFVLPGDRAPAKVESIAASHCKRRMPTYYMKAEGEIDLVTVRGREFVPIEVKWANQLRPQDLKQLSKYRNSILLTKNPQEGKTGDIKTIPLPLFLLT